MADSQRLLNQAAKPLQDAVERVKKILNEIANELEKEMGGAHVAKVSQKTPVQFKRNDAKIVRKAADKKKVRCFKPGDDKIQEARKQGAAEYQKFEKEYYRQLKDQQDGLNGLTVDEYLLGRENYEKYGRGNGSAQAGAREKYKNSITSSLEKSYKKQGKSRMEAEKLAQVKSTKVMKELDALHNPDMIAGGKDRINRLGNSGINRSIGSQWNKDGRLKEMDDYAREMKAKHGGNATMNVELNRCK